MMSPNPNFHDLDSCNMILATTLSCIAFLIHSLFTLLLTIICYRWWLLSTFVVLLPCLIFILKYLDLE